jgi:hypothetical protein
VKGVVERGGAQLMFNHVVEHRSKAVEVQPYGLITVQLSR